MDCIFCSIISGKIPSKKVYEDEKVYAFRDINPVTPVHVLVVPKVHIESLDAVNAENVDIAEKVISAIPAIARESGLKNG